MTAETGSYRWMAPEVIRHEPYGTGCDVYSFGVLCWEMLSYSIPFPHHTPVEVALSVATKGMRPEMPTHAPSVLVDLIEQCWQQDALLRPSFEKVRRATPPLSSRLPSSPSFPPPRSPPSPPPQRPQTPHCSAVRRAATTAGLQQNRRDRGRDGVARAAWSRGGPDRREARLLFVIRRDAADLGL